jgi:hypothetical protein
MSKYRTCRIAGTAKVVESVRIIPPVLGEKPAASGENNGKGNYEQKFENGHGRG